MCCIRQINSSYLLFSDFFVCFDFWSDSQNNLITQFKELWTQYLKSKIGLVNWTGAWRPFFPLLYVKKKSHAPQFLVQVFHIILFSFVFEIKQKKKRIFWSEGSIFFSLPKQTKLFRFFQHKVNSLHFFFFWTPRSNFRCGLLKLFWPDKVPCLHAGRKLISRKWKEMRENKSRNKKNEHLEAERKNEILYPF